MVCRRKATLEDFYELCESRRGRPCYSLWSVDVKQHWKISIFPEPRSCIEVETDVLGSASPIARTVSVGIKQHLKKKKKKKKNLALQSSGNV